MCWKNKYDRCISCGTEEWKHKSSGLCTKCYPLIKLKDIISNWDSNDVNTFIGIPKIDHNYLILLNSENKIDKLKDILLVKIHNRIQLYKRYNSPDNIEPIDIEFILNEIAEITNNISKTKIFHSRAPFYEKVNEVSRSIIYRDLAAILINRRFNLNFEYELYH